MQGQQLDDSELDAFRELAETALAKGCVRARQPGSYHLINLALRPFQTSTRFFQYFNQLQYIWHTLFLKVSQDESIFNKILKLGAESDQWLGFLQKIYNSSKNNKRKDTLTFCRCDYLLEGQQPKIVEYNLMTVGMSFANKLMIQSHRKVFASQKERYFENNATSFLIDAIKLHYTSRKLQGLFLFIISSSQFITIFQQKYIEQCLINVGIKCRRVKLKDLLQYGTKDQNNDLFYQGQLVSFAYYFTGYNLKQYDQIGTREDAIKAKLLLTTTNVTCVPSIQMMIINTKCGQAYLTKPQILRKYLTEQQAQIIQKTFVQNYGLSDLNDSQYDRLITRVQAKPDEWILKPNMQGGGNNIFGSQMLKPLSELKKEDRGKYSIMKKIANNPQYDNYIIQKGMEIQKVRCTYEIGRYGVFSTIGGHLVQNISGGSLIRSKQLSKQCSYIDYGNDGLVAWKMNSEASF